jgi:putative FmdB family regulatory protein
VPTYQYACTECDHSFEQFQSFVDDALTVCPQCQGRLRKVFNAVGVVFKGSGFYRTDSRSTETNGKVDGKPVKAGDTTSDSTSDSRPDTKSGSSSGESSGSDSSSADKPAAKSYAKAASSKDSPSAA